MYLLVVMGNKIQKMMPGLVSFKRSSVAAIILYFSCMTPFLECSYKSKNIFGRVPLEKQNTCLQKVMLNMKRLLNYVVI